MYSRASCQPSLLERLFLLILCVLHLAILYYTQSFLRTCQNVENMKNLAEKFLTPEEQRRVNEAVHKVEKQTSGEVVVMLTSFSHNYPAAAICGTIFFALPLAVVITYLVGGSLWLGNTNLWLFLFFFSLLYLLIHPFFNRFDSLKTLFLNPVQIDYDVRNGAMRAFFDQILYDTRDNNGVLLYISVLERQVWVLADRKVDGVIEPGEWQKIVDQITACFKQNRRCDGICIAVEEIGKILITHFPRKEDDRDELSNLIIC